MVTEIDITRMSSRGQIVIPQDMREDLKDGEKFVVIKNDKQIILKRAKDFGENIVEEIEFGKRTEEAWKQIDKGEYSEYSVEDYKKRLKK